MLLDRCLDLDLIHSALLPCLLSLSAMPKHEVELTNSQFQDLMTRAQEVVDENFSI